MGNPYRRGALLVLFPAMVFAGGCGLFGGIFVDRSEDYLHAESAPRLTLPPGLSESAVEDILVIPNVPPRPQADMFASEPPRPTTLYGPEQEETIKIQMLGDARWLVIPQAPAVVWPQMVRFFMDNGVPIESESPSRGELHTGWMTLDGGDARDSVRAILSESKAAAGVSGGQDRLTIRLEQGLRERTSEIVMRHEHVATADRVPEIDADETDAAPAAAVTVAEQVAEDVEMALLNELGAYLAANVGEPAFSVQAAALAHQGKARVAHDADGMPMLRLDLDFDRAWATLRQALLDAGVDIKDLDRSEGLFYVEMTESELTGESRPGFLRRGMRREEFHALRLKIQPDDGGYNVTLRDEHDSAVDRDRSHAFLVRLRQFAT